MYLVIKVAALLYLSIEVQKLAPLVTQNSKTTTKSKFSPHNKNCARQESTGEGPLCEKKNHLPQANTKFSKHNTVSIIC